MKFAAMICPGFTSYFSGVLLWAVAVALGVSSAPAQAPTTAPAAPSQAQPAPVQPPPLAKAAPKPSVTLLEDTLIRVITNEPVSSKRSRQGSPILFTVSEDVAVGDTLAIPQGATVRGIVVESRKSGVLTGSPEITIKLVSLELGGRTYPLYTYQFRVTGVSKTGPTKTKAIRGAYVGAVAGSIAGGFSAKNGPVGAGHPVSALVGAGAGAGVGTAVSAATHGPVIWIPSEAQVDFYLAAPITVTPVSAKEAARLAQGLKAGGPTLYVRGDTP